MSRPPIGRLFALGRVLVLVALVVVASLAIGVQGTSSTLAGQPSPEDAAMAAAADPVGAAGALDHARSGGDRRHLAIAGDGDGRDRGMLRLVTGEVVTVTDRGGDVAYAPREDGALQYVETPTRTYLFPPRLDLGTYDPALFDVQALAAMGVADGAPIPVLLETDAAADAIERPGLRNVRRLPSAGVVAAEVEPVGGPAAIDALVAEGVVTHVGLDGAVEPVPGPHRSSDGGRTDTAVTGEGVTVAVLDSGIDSTHPALADRVIDRVDLVDGNDPRLDVLGHGTHVAGVLAGAGTEDGEYVGVAPGASLVDVTVIGDRGRGRTSTVIAGVEYAVEEADVDVILLSLGSSVDGSDALAATVEWATDEGVIVVAAIGNNAFPRAIGAPGRPPGVITVGATGRDGRVAQYSARGPTLDGHLKPELVAPGERVIGPASAASNRITVDDRYTWITGTSASAAQVAGAVALLLEADPTLSPRAIENRLASAANPLPEGGAYAQGGGELSVSRALDPDIVATDAVVDFGLIESDDRRTRTVTLANRDDRRHDLSFDLAVTNADTDTDATGIASLNRSGVSLAPGERATIALTVDGANATTGAHGGTIRYAVDGEPRSLAFGFVRGGTVTVEKRPLSDGGAVDGDALWVFTEERTHDEVREFENGTASFVAGGGTYVLWSSGVDEPTGTQVLLSEHRRFRGPEHVVLDERETVPVGVNASPIVAAYGRLANLSVVASMSAPRVRGAPKLSVSRLTTDSRAVRVSPDPAIDIATTFLLAPDAARGAELDVPDVFHLVHSQRGVSGPSLALAAPERLVTAEHEYHRTTVDETYRVQDRAEVDGVWNYKPLTWFEFGGRTTQRVHRLPAGATYTRSVEGSGWHAQRVTRVESDAAETDVLTHPLVGLVETLAIADGNVSLAVAPFSDGAGSRLTVPGNHTLTVTVDGDVVQSGPVTGAGAGVGDLAIAPGDELAVRLDGTNAAGRLSTATVTEVGVSGYDPDAGIGPSGANDPPIVRSITVEGADAYNAVEAGEVTVAVDVDRFRAVINPAVWYATGPVEDPPWENRSAWRRAEPRRFDGRLVATFDVTAATETVHLAVEATTIRGHYARTMTTDAFHVGEAPNTSTSMITGRFVTGNGTPATNATVMIDPVAGGSTQVVRTDAEGRFEAEVPRDRTYDVQFVNGEPWAPRASIGADRPAWLALDRVQVGEDVDLGNRTLPPGHPLEILVLDERGAPVEDATVRITHRGGDPTGTVTLTGRLRTSEDGAAVLNRTDGPGVGLAGELAVEIEPPDAAMYPEQTHRFDLTLRGSTASTVTIETAPPDATLVAGGRFLPGYLVILSGSKSDVPAGVAEYRWDLDGDGVADRVTGPNESTIRYDPEEWGREPVLTVVDEAGKTDRSSVVVPERTPATTDAD